jgi:hypothetical protein
MNEEKNKFTKIVLPIVAVLVIAESIAVITSVEKRQNLIDNTSQIIDKLENKAPTAVVTQNDLAIDVKADKTTLAKGQKSKVTVSLNPVTSTGYDSVAVYLSYDPSLFDISQLTAGKAMPSPVFLKASTKEKMIVANFLISEKGGLKAESGSQIEVFSFNATAKKSGVGDFKITTGKGSSESASMIVENGTSKVLPFKGNSLTINISN